MDSYLNLNDGDNNYIQILAANNSSLEVAPDEDDNNHQTDDNNYIQIVSDGVNKLQITRDNVDNILTTDDCNYLQAIADGNSYQQLSFGYLDPSNYQTVNPTDLVIFKASMQKTLFLPLK